MDITAASLAFVAGGVAMIVFRRWFTKVNCATQNLLRGKAYSPREEQTSNYVVPIIGVVFTIIGLANLFNIVDM